MKRLIFTIASCALLSCPARSAVYQDNTIEFDAGETIDIKKIEEGGQTMYAIIIEPTETLVLFPRGSEEPDKIALARTEASAKAARNSLPSSDNDGYTHTVENISEPFSLSVDGKLFWFIKLTNKAIKTGGPDFTMTGYIGFGSYKGKSLMIELNTATDKDSLKRIEDFIHTIVYK